jgi:hypothetical protein
MKVISVTDSQDDIKALLDQAREEDIVLQTADGTEFIVSVVDDFDLEIARTRQNEKLMAFLEQRARQPATISLEDFKQELGLS